MTWKVHTRYDVGIDTTRMLIVRENWDGTRDYVRPLELHQLKGVLGPSDFTVSDDSRFVTKDFLRAMMNEAWNMGMRPDGFGDTSLQVKALTEHKDDLRTLLFANMGVVK